LLTAQEVTAQEVMPAPLSPDPTQCPCDICAGSRRLRALENEASRLRTLERYAADHAAALETSRALGQVLRQIQQLEQQFARQLPFEIYDDDVVFDPRQLRRQRFLTLAEHEAVEARSLEYLKESLTSVEWEEWKDNRSFHVIGGCTGSLYRIRYPDGPYNVDWYDDGAIVNQLCFGPKPHPSGIDYPPLDVMVIQKHALELEESEVLKEANPKRLERLLFDFDAPMLTTAAVLEVVEQMRAAVT
jgi:hypothetical protein